MHVERRAALPGSASSPHISRRAACQPRVSSDRLVLIGGKMGRLLVKCCESGSPYVNVGRPMALDTTAGEPCTNRSRPFAIEVFEHLLGRAGTRALVTQQRAHDPLRLLGLEHRGTSHELFPGSSTRPDPNNPHPKGWRTEIDYKRADGARFLLILTQSCVFPLRVTAVAAAAWPSSFW